MLKDILFLTKKICSEDLLEEISLYKQSEVYDVYRKLHEVINDVNLVVNHLQLTFFRDKNLKRLNKTTKMYLHNLSMLNPIYIQDIYGLISYYTFVKYEYNISFLESKSNLLHLNKLKIKQNKQESSNINEYKKIDLFTLEAKINLRNELIKINDELLEESTKLKKYIEDRFTLNDLL
jgi:hypothetical protein